MWYFCFMSSGPGPELDGMERPSDNGNLERQNRLAAIAGRLTIARNLAPKVLLGGAGAVIGEMLIKLSVQPVGAMEKEFVAGAITTTLVIATKYVGTAMAGGIDNPHESLGIPETGADTQPEVEPPYDIIPTPDY